MVTSAKINMLSLAPISISLKLFPGVPSTFKRKSEPLPLAIRMFEIFKGRSLVLYTVNICVALPTVVNTVSKIIVSSENFKLTFDPVANSSFLQPLIDSIIMNEQMKIKKYLYMKDLLAEREKAF